jgi:hypothetical protein
VNIIIYFIVKSESNLTMLNTFLVSEYDLLREQNLGLEGNSPPYEEDGTSSISN